MILRPSFDMQASVWLGITPSPCRKANVSFSPFCRIVSQEETYLGSIMAVLPIVECFHFYCSSDPSSKCVWFLFGLLPHRFGMLSDLVGGFEGVFGIVSGLVG
jgi:hypothetical protein